MGVIIHDFAGDVQYFLKIDGIEGESQDAAHLREIEIPGWSWGESQLADSSGAGAGKVKMQDFLFTMPIN